MTKFTFKELLTPEESANYLKISKSHFLHLFREGKIGGYKLGYRTLRFKVEDLDFYLLTKEKKHDNSG